MIVHVVAGGEVGGAERMLVDLLGGASGAARLPASDAAQPPASVALLTPNPAVRKLFLDAGLDVDDRGPVREHPLSFLRPSDVVWLRDVLRRRNARIVHLHTFASQVLGTRAAQAVGARIVRTEHSTRVYDDPSCRPFARWSLARADRIVFISDHVRRVARARLPALANTSVIHNGIDPTRFAAAPAPDRGGSAWDEASAEKLAAIAGWGMLGRRLRLVAVGRLDPRKGLDLAIDAVGRVGNAELEIVGEGSERARLEKLAAPYADRIRLSGYTDDVRSAVARADAVLSSAREEGLGIALLEAMAMSRPVIAVPVGGIPEFVDATTGWLAEQRTPSALATVIHNAAQLPEELIARGAAARARVLADFTVDAMRAKYAALYDELLR